MMLARAVRSLSAVAAGLGLMALVGWPALAQAQTVSVVPSDTALVNGETFTVRVATDGSTDLRGYHLVYQYDHTQLQFVSASVGDLASGHNPQAFLVPDVLSAPPDSVIYDVALLGTTANGPGILAYFTFKAVATTPGTAITPLKVDFRNSANVSTLPATSGGTVHVNDVLQVGLGTNGVTPATCFGGSDGAIDITATGGVPPYSYAWSNSATSEDLSGVAAGPYTVTVTDVNGRTASGSWTVTQPTAVLLSLAKTDASCFGGSDGSVTATFSGGTGAFQIKLGAGGTYAAAASPHAFSGLAAGSYTVYVKDANNCETNASITVDQPTAVTLSLVRTDVSCFGGSNGSIAATFSGGTGAFQIKLGAGGTYAAAASPFTFSGLAAGSYTVYVKDANNCETNTSITVDQPTALALSLAKTDVTCNGGADGSVTATFSGGTAPYQVKLGAGGTYAAAASPHTFSGLNAGSYTVYVLDANGCETNASIDVSQTSAVTLSLAKTDVTCNGAANGTITATFSGGTGTYQVKLGAGGTFVPATSPYTFSALAPGTYDVFVKDANVCTTTASVSVTEPAVLGATETHAATCLGSPDGSIDVTVSGGTPPYTFLWNDAVTTEDRTGLAAGSYSVTVTDAHGCTASLGPVSITVRTYTITPTAGAGGSIGPNTVQTVNCGADQSFTITANTCFTFTGLVVDGAPVTPVSPYTFTNVHGSHTIAASFTAIPLPLPVTSLTAARTTSGNDNSGIAKITVTYTAPGDGNTVEIWRKGFGNYPEYDDGPGAGSIPALPASYPPAGWTKTTITASGQTDLPPSRDYWYYVAYTVNSCGETTVSTVKSGGALDYFLGDVHNGTADCTGDNQVTLADISFLGDHYGAHLSDPDPLACLDVGPTSTNWVDGLPATDNQIEFEDLIMFAINFGTVSAPSLGAKSTPGVSSLSLDVPGVPAVGQTFDAVIGLKAGGDVQGLSVKLLYDANVVEPVKVAGGSLLSQQAGPAQVFSPAPGTVDAAVFGNGLALAGSGDLARVTFRVKAAGDPAITLGSARARDARNQPVTLASTLPVGLQPPPTRTELAPSYPNPFNNAMTVVFGMPKAGWAKLAVFDIQGRTVRHLLDGAVSAGWTRTTWNGRSDDGLALAPGMYVIRLAAGDRVITKSVRLVR